MFEIIDLTPRSVLVHVFRVLFIWFCFDALQTSISSLNFGSNVTFMRTYPTSPNGWLCFLLTVCVCVCECARTVNGVDLCIIYGKSHIIVERDA